MKVRMAVLVLAVCASACGGSNSWTCEKDTTLGLANSRNADTGAVIDCRGSWGCEDHSYKLQCDRLGQDWSCTCEVDGFQKASFVNADICDIAARTPTDGEDVEEMNTQIRTRINAGCGWSLPFHD